MRRTKEEALQTRDTVLKAAAQVIIRQGVTAFTIDAVAQEAGVTKGGVLHHFPSKEALVDGLIEQVTDSFNSRLADELAAEPAGQPGRWLRAYIRTVFSSPIEINTNLIPALAAVAADDLRLARIRASLAESQRAAVEDGLDTVQATIIWLAVEGLLFTEALHLNVLDEAMSQRVYDNLLRLTLNPKPNA